MWESFLFIFVVRAYDVGDKISISGIPGTVFIYKIKLFTTEAFNGDGQHMIIPNTVLASSTITQMQRSKNVSISFAFTVDSKTTQDQINIFREKLEGFFTTDTAAWKYSDSFVYVSDLQPNQRLILNIGAELKDVTWQKSGQSTLPKSRLLMAIKEIFEESKISYFPADQKIIINDQKPSLAEEQFIERLNERPSFNTDQNKKQM